MPPKLTDYKDITALVTGASSGIGRTLSKRLAKLGAKLALVARNTGELESLAQEIRADGGDALVLPCDVSILSEARHACSTALEYFGHIDLLFNNAGYGHHKLFIEWDIEDQEQLMRVNYFGMMYFTKLLLPQMIERKRGWIVFTSSVAGKLATPEESAYAASKFATTALAESLSLEVEDNNIHVLNVCPGAIKTPFFDTEALRRMPPVAIKTMGDPDILVTEIIKALAKGKHELTYPKGISAGYIVRALAPKFMRKQVKRVTLDAIAKFNR